MEGYLVYLFLGVFLALSLLIYANLLIFQFFELRFGFNEKQSERIMHGMLVTSLSFMWYSISLSFTLYNKWILQEWHGGFHFPILITTVHMVMKYFITRVWAMTPDADEVPAVPWKILSSIVMPIGLCTSADIVFSNIAIQYLPLSIYTTTKGATLVFTYLLGVMCKLEEFHWSLFLAIMGIISGLGLAIASSGDSVSALGLLCVTLSAAASAIRWVLMQLLAVRDVKSESVMVTLFRFSPYSAASIIPFALLFETPRLVHSSFAEHSTMLIQALMYALLGGVVSFLLIIAEVKLLRVTSSLTMCVIGQIKEIIQIAAAMVLFKDHITAQSGLGIAVSIIAAYWYRHLKSAVNTTEEDEEQAATLQILQSSQLAHRSLYASQSGTHTRSSNGHNNGTGHRYVGVNTQSSVPQIDVEDEMDALLFEQEMVHLDLSPAKLRESGQEIEMGQIHQLHLTGTNSDSGSDDDVEKMLGAEGEHAGYAHANNGTYSAVVNPIVAKRSFSNDTRALFVAGLEGSGHHAFASMMAECETTGCLYEQELSALSVSYNSSVGSTEGLFAGTDGERNNIFITKMLARMSNISANTDSKLHYIGLKDARVYEGMMSYPNGPVEHKTLDRPDMYILAAMAEAVRLDMRFIVLLRGAADVLHSTVDLRHFGSLEPQILIANAESIYTQLNLITPEFYRCVQYENLVHMGLEENQKRDFLDFLHPCALNMHILGNMLSKVRRTAVRANSGNNKQYSAHDSTPATLANRKYHIQQLAS